MDGGRERGREGVGGRMVRVQVVGYPTVQYLWILKSYHHISKPHIHHALSPGANSSRH